ncbi:Neuropeptide F receptor [Aphelenchoides bicaudatus]|nr:Neuropeptide F receptor [Aphelenchoides bicaudatus]
MATTLLAHTSTQPSTAIAANANYTRVSCDWLEEVSYYQNNFYWRHKGASKIIVLYSLVCTFGGLANLLVITSFLITPHLRNLRNYFIVNLAISDLLLCTVTAPFTLYLTLNLFWPFGNVACQFVASAQAVNLFVSCLTLVLIAMDRFLLTLCPVKWRMAAKAPCVFYLAVWLMALIVALPYFFAVSAETVDNLEPWNSPKIDEMLEICDMKKPKICLERTWHRLPVSRRTYTLIVLAIQYCLPLAALGFAYSQIGSTIRKRVKYNTTVDHHRKALLLQRNRKSLLLLLLLVLIYGIAWLPMNLYNMLNVFEVIEFSQYYYIFCHLIGMTSASINPIMYALINDSFRSAFFNMLRPVLKPCTKYISVSPDQRNTHTTYSFTMNVLGSPRRDFKIPADSSVPLIHTPQMPQANGQENSSATLLRVP